MNAILNDASRFHVLTPADSISAGANGPFLADLLTMLIPFYFHNPTIPLFEELLRDERAK